MKFYTTILACFLIFGTTQLKAQQLNQDFGMNQLLRISKQSNASREAVGSHYLYEKWAPGRLFIRRGDTISTFKSAFTRYNVKEQQVEIGSAQDSKSSAGFFDDSILMKFELVNPKTNKTLSFQRTRNLNLPSNIHGFVEVLYHDKDVLFCKKTFTLVKTSTQNVIGGDSEEDQLVKKKRYYLSINGKTSRLKKSKRFILGQMGDKASKVKAFAKKNKLRYRRDNDLVKILQYYNTL